MSVAIFHWGTYNGSNVFARLFAFGVGPILGIRVKVNNRNHLTDIRPCVVVGNHQSLFDLLVQGSCVPPGCVGIGKKEIIWAPLFGLAFLATGNILIDRSNPEVSHKQLNDSLDLIIKNKLCLYLFPEGTRNRDAINLLPFKRGAFRSAIVGQMPIIPVVAEPLLKVVNMAKGELYGGEVRVDVLDPIPTTGLTLNDVDALSVRVHKIMNDHYNYLRSLQN